jgi:N-acetyl-gamma-glutamyl-phosphate reductase
VIVAGASGFAGALASHLLWRHPGVKLTAVTARTDAGRPLRELYPRYAVPLVLSELELQGLEEVDAAIVSYPHGAAAPVVAGLRGLGVQVVDLSADYRLRDVPTYERWYGPHGEPDLLEGAVYGLSELRRDQIRSADLVANPGCYATAALLALAPLAERSLIADVVIDAKSGVSGAGRDAGERSSFVDVHENFMPYGVEGHRHGPEIEQELRRPVTFVPHLLPLDQGLLASCYVSLTQSLGEQELRAVYDERYVGEPFVELVDAPPGVRDVRDTNRCRIHVAAEGDGQRALVFAAIDNLWKCAAGQAVQNLNLMLGLDETEGIV